MKFFMGGMDQAILLCGFSKTYGILKCSQSFSSRRENQSKRLPASTFFWSVRERPVMPQSSVSLRKGPGPKPSHLRALEKVVQGIPHQTKVILLERIQLKSLCSTLGFKTSWPSNKQMSTGKALMPFCCKHHVTRAVPANTSRAKR